MLARFIYAAIFITLMENVTFTAKTKKVDDFITVNIPKEIAESGGYK